MDFSLIKNSNIKSIDFIDNYNSFFSFAPNLFHFSSGIPY